VPARLSTLTTRGRVVLASGIGMAIAAWLFGVEELYSLAVGAAVLCLGARIWVDLRRWNLQVSRYVHPSRVAAGQEARVELAVQNQGAHPSPLVEARDPFDGGRRYARFSIAPIQPGVHLTSSYRLPSTRRGVHRLGPLELRLTDPLGLASSTRTTALETSLTVHPRYDIVPVHGLSSHRDEDRRLPQPVIGRVGQEFYGLREYVPGDDLRHVHWPTTARLDNLVIRQPENLRRGRLTIMADLRANVQDDETVEAVLSAVASLAMSSLASGLQVRVVSTAGWDSGHGTGRDHGPALLDGLAAAETHPPRPHVAPFRLAGGLEPLVVVTTDRCSDSDLRSAVGMSGPTGTTMVVFETGPATDRQAGRRLVRVGRGASFAEAWAIYTRMVMPA
jgi:uncharacterized protein (DUF58 family)